MRAAWLPAACVLCMLVGCETFQQGAKKAGERTRGAIGVIDPTGLSRETEARTRLWEDAQLRLTQLEEAVNATLGEATILLQDIAERVGRIDPKKVEELQSQLAALAEELDKQLEDGRISELTTSVNELVQTTNRKLEPLETQQVDAILQDVKASLNDIRKLVSQLDTTVRELQPDLQRTLDSTTRLADNVTAKLDELPLTELRGAVRQVDETTTTVRSAVPGITDASQDTLDSVRLLSWVAIGAVGIFGVVGVVLLVRLLSGGKGEPRPAH